MLTSNWTILLFEGEGANSISISLFFNKGYSGIHFWLNGAKIDITVSILRILMHQFLTGSDIQTAFANYLRKLRKSEKLSRDALAERSTVPAATIKKFELTGQISFRQLLLIWQSLDDLNRLYKLTLALNDLSVAPGSIEEVLKDGL